MHSCMFVPTLDPNTYVLFVVIEETLKAKSLGLENTPFA